MNTLKIVRTDKVSAIVIKPDGEHIVVSLGDEQDWDTLFQICEFIWEGPVTKTEHEEKK